MSAFQGMEELLQDFLTEASELLADVDNSWSSSRSIRRMASC